MLPSGSFWKALLKPRSLGFLPTAGDDELGTGPSLRRRVLKAASWTVLGHVSRQAIRFGSNLVMTRLLLPEAFGVMAIATVLLFGFQLFTDIGLRQNIVQSQRGDDPDFLNSVWTVQILRGAAVCCLSLATGAGLALLQGAHWLAAGNVYGDPRLPPIIFALSFSALVSGFESTRIGTASRHLSLAKVTVLDLSAQIVGLLVTLGWAFLERSVWALVAGALASAAARTLLSHRILPGERNRLHWEKGHFEEIFHFGKWVFLSSVAGFLLMNADRLLLGGLVGPDKLGLYVIAYLIVNSVQWMILNLVLNVSFPLLSETARSNPAALPAAYYRLRQPLELACLSLAVVLTLFGSRIIGLFYDARYGESGLMLEIIALSLATVPYQLSDQLYLAVGESRLLFLLNVIRTLAVYAVLPLGYTLGGLRGALWAIALAPALAVPVSLYLNRRQGVMNGRREALGLLAIVVIFAARPLIGGV